MCKHENSICPRCTASFACRAGDISKCQCYTVRLIDVERDFLARGYTDCLCADCILAVRTAYNQAQLEIQLKQAFGLR
jgi:hypothetical protein